MIKEITYLDLFSGIGGFTKGFLDASLKFKHHYFSEIDKHAIAVYKYNFKNAINAGDIRFISKGAIKHRPNIITFGFPCQDLSIAGNREGLSGSRSGLFFEAVRLIEIFKPEVFIFENVKGLLSNNEGKDFEIVLQTIADIGIYECEWQLCNTRWVLPQNRERVYFIGHLRGKSKPRVFPFREADFEFNERSTKATVVRTISGGGHSGGHHSGMTLINDIEIGTLGTYKNVNGFRKMKDNICPSILGRQRKDGNGQPIIKEVNPDIAYSINTNGYSKGSSKSRETIIAPFSTLDLTVKKQNGRRMGDDGDPSFTLTARNKQGVVINKSLRRLTEIECERLQGFPDNWTKFGNYDGVIKEVSKTQRYKQLGNAVTTNLPRMIAERLFN